MVAHAPPDGYLIDIVPNSHTIAALRYKLNFDPVKSFSPITEFEYVPDVLLVNPSLPVNSVKEFIAHAKAHPGSLNFSSVGPGSASFLEMETFKRLVGINLTHVPFNGGSQSQLAVLGNEVQATFGSVQGSIEQVKAGKLRALAVSSIMRSPAYPNVPTIAEAADLPGFDFGVWYGALAPARTPRAIINKLHDDIAEAMKSPAVQERLTKFGGITMDSKPEEFTVFLAQDIEKWRGVFNKIGADAK